MNEIEKQYLISFTTWVTIASIANIGLAVFLLSHFSSDLYRGGSLWGASGLVFIPLAVQAFLSKSKKYKENGINEEFITLMGYVSKAFGAYLIVIGLTLQILYTFNEYLW